MDKLKHNDILNNFSESLKDIMTFQNKTVVAVCKDTGIKKQSMYGWLLQRTLPRLKTLIVLSDYFRCSIDTLLLSSDDVNYATLVNPVCFFERFRQLFAETKLSVRAFSQKTGVPTSSITHWRQGKSPEVYTLIALSNFFDCSIEYLLGRTNIR